jgi:hypothetical protein
MFPIGMWFGRSGSFNPCCTKSKNISSITTMNSYGWSLPPKWFRGSGINVWILGNALPSCHQNGFQRYLKLIQNLEFGKQREEGSTRGYPKISQPPGVWMDREIWYRGCHKKQQQQEDPRKTWPLRRTTDGGSSTTRTIAIKILQPISDPKK